MAKPQFQLKSLSIVLLFESQLTGLSLSDFKAPLKIGITDKVTLVDVPNVGIGILGLDEVNKRIQLEGNRLTYIHFVYNGKSILKTRLSFGSGDAPAVDNIRQQLKLNEGQFQLLIDCPLKRDDYIEILKSKKLIV